MFPIRILLVLAMLGLAGACGGGGAKPEGGAPPGGEKKDEKKKAAAPTKKALKKGEKEFTANPSWDKIMPHFVSYVGNLESDVHSDAFVWKYKDAFQSHLIKFFPPKKEESKLASQLKAGVKQVAAKAKKPVPAPTKKEIQESSVIDVLTKAAADPTTADIEPEVAPGPPDPLLKHAIGSYRFQIIMTGISNPEVQVQDLEGVTHVLHVNDRIGQEGGYILDILKSEVLVKMPELDTPIVVSLAPPILSDLLQ